MSNLMIKLLLSAALISVRVHAESASTNQWGAASNNVDISISLSNAGPEIKSNQPVSLLFRVRNLSTKETFQTTSADSPGTDPFLSVSVVAPSGKAVRQQNKAVAFSGQVRFIPPERTIEFQVPLSNFGPLNETGRYTVTATQSIFSMQLNSRTVKHGHTFEEYSTEQFTVVSNPLEINVTPGEWKPPKALKAPGW